MHLHSLKLLRQKVKEEMHLQDLQYLTFDEMLPSTLYIMRPIQLQSLKLLRLTVLEPRYIYKKRHYLILDLGVKVTRKVAQYPLHHLTDSATKFEVATSNGLGDAFTRKNII